MQGISNIYSHYLFLLQTSQDVEKIMKSKPQVDLWHSYTNMHQVWAF